MERQRVSAMFSFLLAAGIVIAGILGPLVTGKIRFHLPEYLINQYLGGEVVTMAVAAPALLAAGVLWLKHDRLAPALAFGPAVYTVYTFITAIAGQEYSMFDGNAERAFPLYAALVFGGLTISLMAATDLIRQPAPEPSRPWRTVIAGLFILIAGFFALGWISQIVLVYRGDASADYVDGPTLFWLIKLLDLAIVLPALAVVGVGLLKRHPAAIRLSFGMVSYAACMAGAVLGMAAAMWLKDDPAASPALFAFMAPVTIALVCVAVSMLTLYRHGQMDRLPEDTHVPLLETGHAG